MLLPHAEATMQWDSGQIQRMRPLDSMLHTHVRMRLHTHTRPSFFQNLFGMTVNVSTRQMEQKLEFVHVSGIIAYFLLWIP